jgi:DME family drug/metabolite transporter
MSGTAGERMTKAIEAFGKDLGGFRTGRASASLVTLVTLLEPVFATVLAVLLLGEVLPVIGWVGIALLVSGVAVATVPRRSP